MLNPQFGCVITDCFSKTQTSMQIPRQMYEFFHVSGPNKRFYIHCSQSTTRQTMNEKVERTQLKGSRPLEAYGRRSSALSCASVFTFFSFFFSRIFIFPPLLSFIAGAVGALQLSAGVSLGQGVVLGERRKADFLFCFHARKWMRMCRYGFSAGIFFMYDREMANSFCMEFYAFWGRRFNSCCEKFDCCILLNFFWNLAFSNDLVLTVD